MKRTNSGIDIGTKLMMIKEVSKAKYEKLHEEKENAKLQDCSFKPRLRHLKEETKNNSSSILYR